MKSELKLEHPFDLKLRDKLDAGQLSIDTKGHYGIGLVGPIQAVDNGNRSYSSDAYRANFPYRLAENLIVSLMFGMSAHEHCSLCAKYVVYKLSDNVITAQTECPYPNGYPAFTVNLEVPSGKIIIDNDLRSLSSLDDGEYDVNAVSEMGRLTKDYAQDALVHVFVGNSCPGIYRKSDESLTIESPPHDEDYEPLDTDGEHLGSVITDLWWFSVMDFGEFQRRCTERNIDPKNFTDVPWTTSTIIDVTPGVWQWSVDYMQNRDKNGIVFSVGTRV